MGELRVIAGKAKGRKLRSVPGDTTRPVTDRVKEALFNILGMDVVEATFLDLFGGTGAIGIEALSRGARWVRFVDVHRLPVATIRSNLKETGFDQQAQVLHTDAFKLLEQEPDVVFDYVYIAPPQYQELWKRALLSLDQHPGWLSEDAWVIVQIHPVEYEDLDAGGDLSNLRVFDRRKYGSTLLVFFARVDH